MRSIERLKLYLASDPSNVELACELVDALLSANQVAAAHDAIENLQAAAKEAFGVRFRSARISLLQGRYSEAEAMLRDLASEGCESVAIQHDIAFSQLCLGRTEEATQTLRAAIGQFGNSTELSVLLARVALMDQDYAGAQAALTQALAIAPDHPVAWGLQALGLLDAGEADSGEQVALACLARHPEQHEALLVAGTTALWRREAEAAGAFFQRALDRFPNSGRVLSGQAQVSMLRGELAQARALLEHAVVAMPDHIGTWHALAWAQLLQGERAAAGVSYQAAYDLDRNFAETHGGLAMVAILDDRIAEGEDSMRRALKLDPQSFNGRYAKSLLLELRGESEAAGVLIAEMMAEGSLPGVSLEQALHLSQGIRDRSGTSPRK